MSDTEKKAAAEQAAAEKKAAAEQAAAEKKAAAEQAAAEKKAAAEQAAAEKKAAAAGVTLTRGEDTVTAYKPGTVTSLKAQGWKVAE